MRKTLAIVSLLALLLCPLAAHTQDVQLDPQNPQTLVIWHYYNGIQQQVFDRLVLEFNEGVGAEAGVIVEAHSQGSISDLTENLLNAANREPGAQPMPDLFGAYADTAYRLDQLGYVADLAPYVTQEELAAYVDNYIQEGRLGQPDVLKVFPIAKSTELLLLNMTDWQPFVDATGADEALLSTWEGVAALAEAYYNWSDAQTPDVPGDGKAFFGRDAFANYMLIGSLQLGVEMFRVDNGALTLSVDRAVMRRLWDNYCVPFVNGWFGAYGRFRSDDIKTGQLVALDGSTSCALYFPKVVTRDDGITFPFECKGVALPNFAGTEPCAVQQGAGLVVTRGAPEKIYAAVLFLKWFTGAQKNIEFCIRSGYLPVLKAANDLTVLDAAILQFNRNAMLRQIIDAGVQITTRYRLYTNNAFARGYEARTVVDTSMSGAAKAAVLERDRLVQQGVSRSDAVAQLTGDAAFDAWLKAFEEQLKAALQ